MADSKKTIHQMSDEKKKPGQGETLKKVFRYIFYITCDDFGGADTLCA